MRRHIHARRGGDERGAAAVLVLLGIVVFIGMLALSIDLGIILTARTEAQRTSDGAALAGAASLIFSPNDEAQARQWAKDWAAENPVRKTLITLRDEDIDVLLDERKVRVRTLRRTDYGGPVPTIFARIFDVDFVNVDAVAAAEASEAGVVAECLFPVAIPDRWWNDPSTTLEFEMPPDIYYPPGSANWLALPPAIQDQVGWKMGEEIVFKPSQGGQGGDSGSTRLEPGMWELWLPEAFSGVPSIRDRVWGCADPPDPVYVAVEEGEECVDSDPDGSSCLYREAGNKQTIASEFEALISTYPNERLVWEAGSGCADNSPCPQAWQNGVQQYGFQVIPDPTANGEHKRYRPAPMFDPTTFNMQGSGPHFEISQIAGIFVNRVDNIDTPPGQVNVYGIILPYAGKVGGGTSAGPLVLAVRLVE